MEMETLVVSNHRNHNQCYGRRRGHPAGFRSFGSPPTGNFRGINCRAFQSGAGLLPTPHNPCTRTPVSVSKREFFSSFSPKTPSTSAVEGCKSLKKTSKSNVIPIPIKFKFENDEGCYGEDLHFSEHWAGPAYSCSPPPSSLPMPKFSLRPKRAVSLDLHTSVSDFDFLPMAKSAPASPTRQRSPSRIDPFDSAYSATKTLRRILNLDITDE